MLQSLFETFSNIPKNKRDIRDNINRISGAIILCNESLKTIDSSPIIKIQCS